MWPPHARRDSRPTVEPMENDAPCVMGVQRPPLAKTGMAGELAAAYRPGVLRGNGTGAIPGPVPACRLAQLLGCRGGGHPPCAGLGGDGSTGAARPGPSRPARPSGPDPSTGEAVQ
jgi:hypothetical protein